MVPSCPAGAEPPYAESAVRPPAPSSVRTAAQVMYVGAAIATVLWLVLARFCVAGRNWARITGTVLFALGTTDTIIGLASSSTAALTRIWATAGWLVAVTATVLLWRRSSGDYFTGQAARP